MRVSPLSPAPSLALAAPALSPAALTLAGHDDGAVNAPRGGEAALVLVRHEVVDVLLHQRVDSHNGAALVPLLRRPRLFLLTLALQLERPGGGEGQCAAQVTREKERRAMLCKR